MWYQIPRTGWNEQVCAFDSLNILVYPLVYFLFYSFCVETREQMRTHSWLLHIRFLKGPGCCFVHKSCVCNFLKNERIEKLNGLKKMGVGRIEEKEKNINKSLIALG